MKGWFGKHRLGKYALKTWLYTPPPPSRWFSCCPACDVALKRFHCDSDWSLLGAYVTVNQRPWRSSKETLWCFWLVVGWRVNSNQSEARCKATALKWNLRCREKKMVARNPTSSTKSASRPQDLTRTFFPAFFFYRLGRRKKRQRNYL